MLAGGQAAGEGLPVRLERIGHVQARLRLAVADDAFLGDEGGLGAEKGREVSLPADAGRLKPTSETEESFGNRHSRASSAAFKPQALRPRGSQGITRRMEGPMPPSPSCPNNNVAPPSAMTLASAIAA